MKRIDLSGPGGNAYSLLGLARELADHFDLDGPKIISDMMFDDYDHLLEVFEKHFSDCIILDR